MSAMDALLANPAVQAAGVPFVVTLIAAWALARAGRYGSGLAVALGFFIAVALFAGIVLPPRTSSQKIIASVLVAVPLAALLDLRWVGRQALPLAAVAGAAAALWVIWPVAMRSEGAAFWQLVLGGAVYVGWLSAATGGLRQRPIAALTAATALGLGTGSAALLGASALLGQLGLALGTAAAAAALLHLITLGQRGGRILTLPVGLAAGLVGLAAVVYSRLPWPALLALALVPPLGCLPLATTKPRLQMVIVGCLTLAAAAAAVVLSWKSAGGGYA